MFDILGKITDQVAKYSSFFGQLWYIIVFVFRLIVVLSLGGAVYGDEQSNFVCNTKEPGCTNICYNQFAEISHMRFWGFQLLAVCTPAVMFQFFALYMSGQIQKWERLQKSVEDGQQAEDKVVEVDDHDKNMKLASKKKRVVGKVKTRHIYNGSEFEEVKVNNKIYVGYYISVLMKFTVEAVFIYLSYSLFYKLDKRCGQFPGAFPQIDSEPKCHYDFTERVLMMTVPHTYLCTDDKEGFRTGCNVATNVGYEYAAVTCYVSRPYEKTIFLRYMNFLSFACLILCALELVFLPLRLMLRLAKRSRRRPPPRAVYIYRNGQAPEMNWTPDNESTSGESSANRRSIAYTDTKT